MSVGHPAAARGKSGLFTYENALVLLLGSSFGFAFFDRQALSFLTPFIVADLHLNNTMVGALASGLSLSWAISSLVIAAWSDATGVRRPFLLGAILIFSLCSMLSGLAGSFVVLLAARVLMGTVEGPFLPICLAIMATESSPHRRGLNVGVMQNMFSATFLFFAPFLLVWLAHAYGWRSAFFISAAPGFLLLLLVARFVREPAKPAIAKPVVDAGPRLGLMQILSRRNIWLCCLISCCMVGWTVLLATFLPLYFVNFAHMPPADMSAVMSTLGVATFISGPLVATLSDRVGRRPAMITFCLVGLIAPAGAYFFPASPFLAGAGILIGWLGSGVFSLFMGAIPGETVPARYAATCMGLTIFVGEIVGGTLAPLIAGRVADLTTLQAPMIAAAALTLGGAILSMFLVETAPAKLSGAAGDWRASHQS